MRPQQPLRFVHMLVDRFGAPSHRNRSHGDGPDGETQHSGRLRRRSKRVPCFGQRAVHPCERPRNVQSVTGCPELRLDADGTDPGRQAGQFVGNDNEFDVKLLVFYALKHLVVPVKAAVEAIVGTPP